MNYQIITDEQKLREFINWLPDLDIDETYYITLFARSKYCKDAGLSGDKQNLKRFSTNKEYMFDKIKQLEVEFGSYKQKGKPIPQEALAVYISINPRSFVKATSNSLKEFVNLITKNFELKNNTNKKVVKALKTSITNLETFSKQDLKDINQNEFNKKSKETLDLLKSCVSVLSHREDFNPHQEVLSQIQVSKGRTIYFDFDNIEIETVKEKIITNNLINTDCLTFLKTRGGFHLLVEVDNIDLKFEKSWHNNIKKLDGVDISGDSLIPIPGTHQGGFTPYLIKF